MARRRERFLLIALPYFFSSNQVLFILIAVQKALNTFASEFGYILKKKLSTKEM